MELLDNEERGLLEALLAHADSSGRNGWHLLEVNAITSHLGLESGRRASALSRLKGKGLLLSVQVNHVDGGRDWKHSIDPEVVRVRLAPPKPPGPRERLSGLAG